MTEARTDYVPPYARDGDVMTARDDFSKVATKPEDRFTMMKQLANLYYGDGKDREAAITYNPSSRRSRCRPSLRASRRRSSTACCAWATRSAP